MCIEKERLRKEILIQNKGRCIALFKEFTNSKAKDINKSQLGCEFYNVALCKMSSCF
jgi:hypothetical protein